MLAAGVFSSASDEESSEHEASYPFVARAVPTFSIEQLQGTGFRPGARRRAGAVVDASTTAKSSKGAAGHPWVMPEGAEGAGLGPSVKLQEAT